MSRIIKRILEGIIELPIRVSPGTWNKDGLVTYIIEVPIPMSRPRLEVELGRFGRQLGKIMAVDAVSKKWELTLIAPCNKAAMRAAQLYTAARKPVNYEMLTVKGRNIGLVLEFDDNIDKDAVKRLALDMPGINKAKLLEVKIIG